MRDILDPASVWLGTPGGAQVFGNKRPVALDDSLTVLKDSGPITVDVLANDFDPEGAALTLISASAALGTAVAEPDNTVTYTPPAGIAGADTVVYEIADDLDQRQTAQINVTITEPELTVTVQPDNTLVVNAETGLIDITITQPSEFAGTYQADTADLTGGPVSLVPPSVSGIVSAGQTLTTVGGLWIYETNASTPLQTWQWQRDGADIVGETNATYAVQPGDLGQEISAVETLTDAFGQRSANTTPAGAEFAPSDDVLLHGWWDASDTATITEGGGVVSSWADKAGGAALSGTSSLATGSRMLNNLNVIDCFGGGYLEASRSLPASGDMSFHMVLIVDGISNAYEAVLAVEATNDFQIDADSTFQFDGRLNAAGIGTPINLSGGPFTGALILSVIFDRTGAAQAEVFVGDLSRGTMGYTTAIDTNAALHVMTNRSRNAWVDGAVAELIVTGDITNRADYHAYLANKWGVS